MKKLALTLSLIGIFALFMILNFSHPIQITAQSDLQNLIDNTKVQVQGRVVSEKQYSTEKVLKLDNNIEVSCTSCPNYLNKTIQVIGTIENYQNRTRIISLSVKKVYLVAKP